MSRKIHLNTAKPLTQEWMNDRRSFLKYMMTTLAAAALAACGAPVEESDFTPPSTEPAVTDFATQEAGAVITEPPAATDLPTEPPAAVVTEPPVATEVEVAESLPAYSCGTNGGAYSITSLCVRDRACIEVCPVDCIVVGFPVSQWPAVYIDQNTCIECGACFPECPVGAIFPTAEVPSQYVARGGEYINRLGLTGHYEGTNKFGNPVILDNVYQLKPGQVVDLTQDIGCNNSFYVSGPGYSARDMDNGI
jgi:ferredoxin